MQFLSVLTVLVACVITIARSQFENGCPESYTPLTAEICMFLSSSGTWLEAASSCPFPSVDIKKEANKTFDYAFNILNFNSSLRDDILENIKKSKIKEIWWLEKDSYLYDFRYKPATVGLPRIPSWEELSFSPYIFSRWKWQNSSDSTCVSYNLISNTFHDRSCSSNDTDLPAICLSARTKPMVTCPKNFFVNTNAMNSTCDQLLTNNNLVGYSWSEGKKKCEELGNGSHMVKYEYKDDMSSISSNCSNLLPIWVEKTDGSIGEIVTYESQDDSEAGSTTRSSEHDVEDGSFSGLNMTSRETVDLKYENRFSCVLCQTDGQQVYQNVPIKHRPDINQSITLQQNNNKYLTLTFRNYDSKEHNIQCITDASTSKFSSPQYNKIEFNITDSLKVLSEEYTNNDMFFLRVKDGKPDLDCSNGNIKKPLTDKMTNLRQFPNGSKNLEISIYAHNSGYHWCMGINKFTFLPMFTDKVLIVTPNDGTYRRYSVLLETKLLKNYLNPQTASQFTLNLLTVLNVSDGIIELKRISNNETRLLFHITLPPDHRPIAAAMEGVDVKNSFSIVSIRDTDTCPSMNTTDCDGVVHVLPATKRGETVILKESNCTRMVSILCQGDSIEGAFWVEPYSDLGLESPNENILSGIDRISPMEAADQIQNLTQNPVPCNQLDEVGDLMDTILSGSDSNAASSNVLRDLEIILSNMIIDPSTDVVHTVKSRVAMLVANVESVGRAIADPVVGVVFTEVDGNDVLTPIRSSESIIPTSRETKVAVMIRKAIISNNKRIAFTVFSKINAFREKSPNVQVNSPVIDIVLSQDGTALNKFPDGEFIDIHFKPNRSNLLSSETKVCVFWDEKLQDWSGEGCILNHTTQDGMDICRCNHLTHFAEIITGGNRKTLSSGHEIALEAISIAGCTLSLFGLLVIVVTAIVFKRWRLEIGNKILLNLSAALALNLVTFLLVYGGVGGSQGAGCISVGAVLHYSVLACFCWMLIMSGLQVLRLLTILGNKGISNLLLKASVFGWGVPLIPVITLLAWNPLRFYSTSSVTGIDRTFCYPSGAAFYATIAAPVGSIVAINLAIYIVILGRLCSCFGWGMLNTDLQRHGITEGIIAMRRLRTLIFLFFLFGLTWTFGFLVQYLFFTYLFCLTAPLQGFVIFVFFFLIEKKSRGHWKSIVSDSSTKKTYSSSGTRTAELFETLALRPPEEESSETRLPNTYVKAKIRPRAHQAKDGGIKTKNDDVNVEPVEKTNSSTYTSFGLPDFLDEGQSSQRDSGLESRRRNDFQTFQ